MDDDVTSSCAARGFVFLSRSALSDGSEKSVRSTSSSLAAMMAATRHMWRGV